MDVLWLRLTELVAGIADYQPVRLVGSASNRYVAWVIESANAGSERLSAGENIRTYHVSSSYPHFDSNKPTGTSSNHALNSW